MQDKNRLVKMAGDRKTYVMATGTTNLGFSARMTTDKACAQIYTKEDAQRIINAMTKQDLKIEECK